jgi:hypothetical protein
LIGLPSESGTIRLFECSREHQEVIIPHSHRFDFQCWVLDGYVRNLLWTRTVKANSEADEFEETLLQYGGAPGDYLTIAGDVSKWISRESTYEEGQCYSMKASEIHSIFFSRGAKVLFFEGQAKTDTSTILQPFVNGKVVPTFKVENWMFDKNVVTKSEK